MGEPTDALLYLEDLSVGMRFRSRAETIGRDEIVAFARQFDPQPFHLDDDAARSTLFGGLAASGWHVVGITMRLTVETVKLAGGIIGASVLVEWPRPTRAGDVLHVEFEIVEIVPSRSKPDRGMVTIRQETKNAKDETVQVMTAKVLSFRRPPG